MRRFIAHSAGLAARAHVESALPRCHAGSVQFDTTPSSKRSAPAKSVAQRLSTSAPNSSGSQARSQQLYERR